MVGKRKKTTTPSLTDCIVGAMQEKKGNNIVVLNLGLIKNAICDSFIICHGTSKTQVDAIADNIKKQVRTTLGVSASHSEGYENSEWLLIDYFDIIVHVFLKESRDYYRLEELWADAEIRYIEQE